MDDEVLLELFQPTTDATAEETERTTQALRSELLDLDEITSVARASAGAAPAGSRGLDIAALGALVVSVEPTVAAISRIVGVVRDWLGRRRGVHPSGESVRITVHGQSLEIAAATTQQQQALVDQFINAVGVKA